MSTQSTSVESINEIFQRVQREESQKFRFASKMFWDIYRLILYRGHHREYKEEMLQNLKQGLREEGIEKRHFVVWRYFSKVKEANAKIVQQVEFLVLPHL